MRRPARHGNRAGEGRDDRKVREEGYGGSQQVLLGCNAFSPPRGDDAPLQNSVVVRRDSVADRDDDEARTFCRLKGLGGADQVWFNPGDNHYFLALGSHAVPGSQLDPGSPSAANNGSAQQLAVVNSDADRRRSSDNLLLGPTSEEEDADCSVDATISVGKANGTARRAHSVAADIFSIFQTLVTLPIPATGGGGSLVPPTAGFQSDLCGSDELAGCVAVFIPEFLDEDDKEPPTPSPFPFPL